MASLSWALTNLTTLTGFGWHLQKMRVGRNWKRYIISSVNTPSQTIRYIVREIQAALIFGFANVVQRWNVHTRLLQELSRWSFGVTILHPSDKLQSNHLGIPSASPKACFSQRDVSSTAVYANSDTGAVCVWFGCHINARYRRRRSGGHRSECSTGRWRRGRLLKWEGADELKCN